MNALKLSDVMPNVRGKLQANASMARYTSWRVGGEAEWLFIPADLEDLQTFLASQDDKTPIIFVGLGSNLLVRDGGVAGVVIVMHNVLKNLSEQGDMILADAGVTCGKLAKFCAKAGKKGAAFFAGIPGTVGGALAMNAGCYGSETWDVVTSVTMINRQGELVKRQRDAFKAEYRHVTKPVADEWYVAAELHLANGDAETEQQAIKDLLAKRMISQPLNKHTAGSTFRNPEGDYAARLIEAAGLKGYIIGGAQVSEKHANFIENVGEANAMDIELLIKHIQDTVKEQFGVALVHEVKMIGDYAQ